MKRFKARLEALDFRKIFIGLIIFVIGVAAIDGSALAVQVHQNPKSGAALVFSTVASWCAPCPGASKIGRAHV